MELKETVDPMGMMLSSSFLPPPSGDFLSSPLAAMATREDPQTQQRLSELIRERDSLNRRLQQVLEYSLLAHVLCRLDQRAPFPSFQVQEEKALLLTSLRADLEKMVSCM